VVKSRPRSDWDQYFSSIRDECPWSYSAWLRGQIDIVPWQGQVLPLGEYKSRLYTVDASDQVVQYMAQELDEGEYEWLFSYPGYGENATPETVLIQQERALLTKIRSKLLNTDKDS